MIKRIISGLIGGALYIAFGVLGGPWLAAALGFILLLGLLEMHRLAAQKSLELHWEIPAVLGLMLLILISRQAAGRAAGAPERILAAFVALLTLCSAVSGVIKGRPHGALATAAITVFAGAYIVLPMAYLLLLRFLPGNGAYYFFLLTAAIWASDSTAYFAGTAFGRHALAPAISPKKTIEGSLAGLLGAAAAAAFLALAWGKGLWNALILGLIAGVVGQIGDLFESLFKRDLDVKDSGRFLPGHGGVLDRFDSLILTAPALYYAAIFLGNGRILNP